MCLKLTSFVFTSSLHFHFSHHLFSLHRYIFTSQIGLHYKCECDIHTESMRHRCAPRSKSAKVSGRACLSSIALCHSPKAVSAMPAAVALSNPASPLFRKQFFLWLVFEAAEPIFLSAQLWPQRSHVALNRFSAAEY